MSTSRTVRQFALVFVLVLGLIGVHDLAPMHTFAATPVPESQPIPLDVAFDHEALSEYDHPALSPNGERLAFTATRPMYAPESATTNLSDHLSSRVMIANVESGETESITPDGLASFAPSWSPDGTQLTFYGLKDDELSLQLFDTTTDTLTVLATDILVDGFPGSAPVWSPDGFFIFITLDVRSDENGVNSIIEVNDQPNDAPLVFTTEVDDDIFETFDELSVVPENALALVHVGDQHVTRLTTTDQVHNFRSPTFSASGEWILGQANIRFDFASPDGFAYDLVGIHARDRSILTIAEAVPLPDAVLYGGDVHAGWHPQDDRVIFVQDGAIIEAILSPEGTETRTVTDPSERVADTWLAISRDGNTVFAQAESSSLDDDSNLILAVSLTDAEPVNLILPPELRFLGVARANMLEAWQANSSTLTIMTLNDELRVSQLVQYDLPSGETRV